MNSVTNWTLVVLMAASSAAMAQPQRGAAPKPAPADSARKNRTLVPPKASGAAAQKAQARPPRASDVWHLQDLPEHTWSNLDDAFANIHFEDLDTSMWHLEDALHDWQMRDFHMPELPQLPELPLLPEMPSMPAFPALPAMPELPALPAMPEFPSLPEFAWQGTPPVPRPFKVEVPDFKFEMKEPKFDFKQPKFEFEPWSFEFQSTPADLKRFNVENLKFIDRLDARMPEPWAQGDVADSLYRSAREQLNRGEWRRAAQILRDLPQKYPNSSYAGASLYWQAFALYRIGGTEDLQSALTVLNTLRSKYPNNTQTDAQLLSTRILGALAARGDSKAKQELAQAASSNATSCDRDEQAVRAEAMNALARTDPENMATLLREVLARKDDCSVQLRKTAVFLIGNRRDADAGTVLTGVLKNDPNIEVRLAAVEWLSRVTSDEGVTTLETIANSPNEDDRLQRAAVRALVNHPSPRARQVVRSIVEKNDAPERLRSEALSAFDRDRATAEDVAWLRSIYTKIDNPRIRQRALSAIVRVSGPETDQFLMSIVKDDNESSEFRATALRRIGQSMSISDLAKMYDGASSRTVRESLINILANRREAEAVDKLVDIAKNGTDPNLRTQAISALANSKDPRARTLLLEIINK